MTAAEVPSDDRVLAPIYRRGDRLMLGMLGLHMAAAVWFGTFYDTWLEAWTIGGIAVGMFGLAMLLLPGSFLTRCISGVSLQAFVALHIYQLHGLAEMHFFFFTAFAAMLVYQDWRCMWPGALLIIAQHILFAVMHNQGVNVWFFEDDYIGFTKLGFHFGIALFHVGLCNIWAILLRRQTLHDARIRVALAAAQAAAERESAAKTEFLGDMSHELRTPMAGVMGMTELLLQQQLTPDQRSSLEVVHNSAKAIVEIVNDALDLARVEAGRLVLTGAPMNLRRLGEEVVELLQPRAAQHGAELVVRWQPGGPHVLFGDEGRWRQILINLTGNAIKFARGGHVLLDIAVSAAPVGTAAAVTVRVDDDGKGIPPELLPRLFGRFEQGSAATYAASGGSGLGLAICKELTHLMGARLTVHSVHGAGTTFVVEAALPVVEAAPPPPRAEVRALLLGSSETSLGVIAEQLEAMGAEVVVALDVMSAQRLVTEAAERGLPFQMLLTDPEALPQLTGIVESLRVVLLGGGGAETAGERIVWLTRHQELHRIVAGLGERGAAPSARALPRLGLRVLLVEDDAVCARVAVRMLEMLDCTVRHAVNGAEAVASCRDDDFDVILMDCRMPVMDGYEATGRIRAAAPAGTHTAIIALSANSLPSDRDACLRAGADAFLTKPVSLRELSAALAGLPRPERSLSD